jgi:hypothetical protein
VRIAVDGNPTAGETAAIVAALAVADGGAVPLAAQATRVRRSWAADADTYDALRAARRSAQRRAERA